MLRLEDIRFTRGEFVLVADWSLPPGGITAVIGPSGGGKSTLLDLIAGFEQPQMGRVLWQDRDLTPLPPGERPVTTLFQDGNLFPHLTARQNVVLALSHARRPPREALRRADAALERAGLAGLGDRRPAELSGGQRSRVALARTLLGERPIVLLDEPFAALGPALRREMLEDVVDLLSGRTILMVTHAPDEARHVAGRTIFVAGGRAHPPRETAALFDDPPPGLAAYLG